MMIGRCHRLVPAIITVRYETVIKKSLNVEYIIWVTFSEKMVNVGRIRDSEMLGRVAQIKESIQLLVTCYMESDNGLLY